MGGGLTMGKVPCAITGSGNLGTDLMIKVTPASKNARSSAAAAWSAGRKT